MKKSVRWLLFTMLWLVALSSYGKEGDCSAQHFIGTGSTADLSFSVCKSTVASVTFKEAFVMNCQRGLVTYFLKQRPEAKYLQIGGDGKPLHCSNI